MLVLSIISLILAIASSVVAGILWKKCADLMSEVAANYLTISTLEKRVEQDEKSLTALEKQVKAQSLTQLQKPAETEKKPTTIGGLENVVYYDLKSKTVTLSANLLVKGWITAEKEREEE